MLFKIDESKLLRQEEGIAKWGKTGKGTLQHIMGFGKTYEGILIIQRVLAKSPNAIIRIVVTSNYIKENWNKYLEYYKLSLNTFVFTANEIIVSNYKESADLLIIDELHKFTSEKRLKIVSGEYFKYRWNLGLTGCDTSREIQKYFPIVDKISEEEGIANGWISNFVEYNLALNLNEEDKLKYASFSAPISDTINAFKGASSLFATPGYKEVFRNDYDLLTSCYSGKYVVIESSGKTIRNYVKSEVICDMLAEKKGWIPKLELSNDYNQMLEDNWNPSTIKERATQFNELVRLRNQILINNKIKLQKVVDLYNKFKLTTICFNESTEFADLVTDTLNLQEAHTSICYHSNIQSRTMLDEEGNIIKTKAGKVKSFGKVSLLKMAIEGVKAGFYKVLTTVKALDEGLDIPNIEIVITTGGDTNPLAYAQKKARGKRVDIYNPSKITKIVNLYFDNFSNDEGKLIVSRDLTKLKLRQQLNEFPVHWINNIEEIE